MTLRIDAHQHYWEPLRGDYDWMPPDDPVLARRYGPEDLAPALAAAGIRHTVLVQAAATVEETEYLLGIADATPSVAAVVGWIDFEEPDQRRHLARLSRHPKFVGVRPMIQDIADVDWMLRPDIAWAFEALVELDLTFDALGFPRHLDNFHTLIGRYPDLRVVIDHCMKPQIRDHRGDPSAFDRWAAGMTRLAADTQALCKLSGLVTESAECWGLEDLRPCVDHVLRTFGPKRVMWGSDWPVCRLRASYDRWHDTAATLCADLDPEACDQIFGGTASEFYRLQT